jgi:hypothetical protein
VRMKRAHDDHTTGREHVWLTALVTRLDATYTKSLARRSIFATKHRLGLSGRDRRHVREALPGLLALSYFRHRRAALQ